MEADICSKPVTRYKHPFSEGLSRNNCRCTLMRRNHDLTTISQRLLSYVRSELDTHHLTYLFPLTPVTGGYNTRVFSFQLKGASLALSRTLILRLFRDTNPRRAIFESAVQNAIASTGFPVPCVFFTCTDALVLGGNFMIMELLPGQPMLNLPMPSIPKLLVTTHLHLHNINVDAIRTALDSAGIHRNTYSLTRRLEWLAKQIEPKGLEGLQSGVRWLIENRPEAPERAVICHGDFHPINILVRDGQVRGVLDWSGFLVGDPAYDIGITKVLGIQVAPFLFPTIEWAHMIKLYCDYYQRERPVDPERIVYYEALRCLWALLEGAAGHTAFSRLEIMRTLSTHFEQIADVRIADPRNRVPSL